MKQLNVKLRKLCSETFKTLINELNRPASQAVHSVKLLQKKLFVL